MQTIDAPHHERIADPEFRRAVDLVDAGDAPNLRAHLDQFPDLVRQHVSFDGGNYFQSPTLLEFVAENPVRHGSLPPNIVEIAAIIIDAGAERSALNETLGLVATGRVTRECGVQVPLINLLCERGANPAFAIHVAAAHGELQAVEALIAHGAHIDLAVVAALGRTEDARRLLSAADADTRHLALAFAAQFGNLEIVQLLLDAGEDPNRYNPSGAHSHSTPLHQAAFAGHAKVVRLLVDRGARLDQKDVLWHGTPADWAEHAGRSELETYLREREKNCVN